MGINEGPSDLPPPGSANAPSVSPGVLPNRSSEPEAAADLVGPSDQNLMAKHAETQPTATVSADKHLRLVGPLRLAGTFKKKWRTIAEVVALALGAISALSGVVRVIPSLNPFRSEPSPTPFVPIAAAQIATSVPTPTLTPSSPVMSTPTLFPTPCLVVSVERLPVYAGPGESFELWGEVRRGDQLLLYGRSADGQWWQVDYLGRKGWIRSQPVGINIAPLTLPVIKALPPPTRVPTPTATPSLPEPNTVLPLQNAGFERIQEKVIPGWHWWAEDNFTPGGEYDSGTSFDTPFFSQANDPARMIDGPTLQIEAVAFVNFKVYIFQIASAVPGTTVRFQASAQAYSSEYRIRLKAGIDPNGGPDCSQAQWGDTLTVDQSDGTVRLVTPIVTVGDDGRVTVCLHAENIYPTHCNAAYFDNAALIANPE